jgi:hypothetical protein
MGLKGFGRNLGAEGLLKLVEIAFSLIVWRSKKNKGASVA